MYIVTMVEDEGNLYREVIGVYSRKECELRFDKIGYEWYEFSLNQESKIIKEYEDIFYQNWKISIEYNAIEPIAFDNIVSNLRRIDEFYRIINQSKIPQYYFNFIYGFVETIMEEYEKAPTGCFFQAKQGLLEIGLTKLRDRDKE